MCSTTIQHQRRRYNGLCCTMLRRNKRFGPLCRQCSPHCHINECPVATRRTPTSVWTFVSWAVFSKGTTEQPPNRRPCATPRAQAPLHKHEVWGAPLPPPPLSNRHMCSQSPFELWSAVGEGGGAWPCKAHRMANRALAWATRTMLPVHRKAQPPTVQQLGRWILLKTPGSGAIFAALSKTDWLKCTSTEHMQQGP